MSIVDSSRDLVVFRAVSSRSQRTAVLALDHRVVYTSFPCPFAVKLFNKSSPVIKEYQ
jgi:hypothetical protein